jgi:hypothetical protein
LFVSFFISCFPAVIVLFTIKYKIALSSVLVVKVLETLIIYSQLKVFSVLDYVQHVVIYLEWVLKSSAKFLDFIDKLAISENFLFPSKMTANQLDSHHLRGETELPNELNLRPISLVTI